MATNDSLASLESFLEPINSVLQSQSYFADLLEIIESETQNSPNSETGPAKKRSYKQRSDKIAEASEELEKGKISAAIFLNRMAYADNHICSDLDDFSCVDDPRPENDNCDLFEDDEEATPTPSQSDAALRLSPCCVCLDNVSQVTLYPCGHLKVCEDCWTKLVNTYDANLAKFLERDLEEEYRPKLKCPCCNTLIENYCKTFT